MDITSLFCFALCVRAGGDILISKIFSGQVDSTSIFTEPTIGHKERKKNAACVLTQVCLRTHAKGLHEYAKDLRAHERDIRGHAKGLREQYLNVRRKKVYFAVFCVFFFAVFLCFFFINLEGADVRIPKEASTRIS